MRRGLGTLVSLAIVSLTVLAVSGTSRYDGPVLLEIADRHGFHLGDLVPLAIGAMALMALALWRPLPPRTGPTPAQQPESAGAGQQPVSR